MEDQMKWLDEVYALAKEDAWCIQCRKQVEAAEPAYLQLRERLCLEDQEALEKYISACEELRFSLVPITYELGRSKQ